MKKTILALTLAAAFMLPAHAHEGPADDNGRATDFTFNFDLGEILAQADAARPQMRIETVTHTGDVDQWMADFADQMQGSMTYMFADRAGRGRVVKGQPYSADIVTETNQGLPDGNVISHRSVNKVWRDGEGRTRQENYRAEKLRSIYISDPVGAMSYTLIPGSKIAVAIPRPDTTHAHPAPRVRIERPERPKTSTTTETSPDGRRVTTIRTVNSDGEPGTREEVRVQVFRVGDDANIMIAPMPLSPPVPAAPGAAPVAPVPPVPPIPPIPGVNTMRFESTAHLGRGETKSLGTKDFEGVKAEGKQTTWTIPAGKIGNKNPINVTSESWYAPDLQVTVYSRHNDPRTGESIYRLAALKRAEPAPDLFKVPADYTTKGRGAKEKDKQKEKDK